MTWQLPDAPPLRTYARNPLEVVVAQLRFDPILNVRARVAELQDAVRARFPLFEEHEGQLVHIEAPTGQVQVRRVAQHRFAARDEPTTAVLDEQSVALEYRAHRERDVLLRDARLLFDAVTRVYAPLSATRLGLRYVNVIDREQISRDLGRPLEWPDLVAESFLRLPTGLCDLTDTRFGTEIASRMPVGSMTLRYGLLPAARGGVAYRFDIDRFVEGVQTPADAVTRLADFVDDVFRLFCTMPRPALIEWMEGT